MFFDMFTKNEISFVQDDYKLLDNESISTYDKKGIESKIKHLISSIQEAECKYLEFLVPNLTPSYELKEEMFTNNKSNPTEKLAIKRIDTAEDLKKVYNKFQLIFNNLFCYYEKVVFVEMILLKRSKETMLKILCIGSDKLYQAKYSCIIKLAIGLQWDNIKN